MPVVQRGAGEKLPAVFFADRFHLAGNASRCVTFAAMPQPLHEISAAVPRRAFVRISGVFAFFEIKRIPDRHEGTHAERPAQMRRTIRIAHRLHTLHKPGIERRQVFLRHPGVGRIGHGRIKTMPVLCHAFAHDLHEIFHLVATDPGFQVRRDIGRINRPDRRG